MAGLVKVVSHVRIFNHWAKFAPSCMMSKYYSTDRKSSTSSLAESKASHGEVSTAFQTGRFLVACKH